MVLPFVDQMDEDMVIQTLNNDRKLKCTIGNVLSAVCCYDTLWRFDFVSDNREGFSGIVTPELRSEGGAVAT